MRTPVTWTPDSIDPPPGDATRDEMRAWIDNHALAGIEHCPVCTRRVQHEAYPLRRSWVEVLKRMARVEAEWMRLDMATFGPAARTAPSLRYWGLIEREAGRRDDGYRSTGYYRITTLGWRFLRRVVSVPRRVITFEAERLRYEDEGVRVWIDDDELGGPFHFDRHMRGQD